MDSAVRRFIEDEKVDYNVLDQLPYGSILVDENGKVLFYNKREAEHTGLRKEDVEGKNFFTEIAPCAQIESFYGQFKRSVKTTGVFAEFHFHFPFPGRPRDVTIVMTSFYHFTDLLCLILIGEVSR